MTWAPLLHPVIVLALGVVGCLIVVRSFRRYDAPLLPAQKRTLLALRIALVILLTLFLLNPGITTRRHVEARGEVFVLVDHSDSMNIRDETGNRSRLERANELLRNWIDPSLRARAELHYAAFDSQVRAQTLDSLLDQTVATGASTNLGDAVLTVCGQIEPGASAAILVISDGASNAGRDVETMARQAREQWDGPPVHALAIGSVAEGSDLELQSLNVARHVFLDEPIRIRGSIRHRGLGGSTAEFVIQEEMRAHGATAPATREIHRSAVTFTGNSGVVQVSHEYRPDTAGERILRMRIAVLPGEIDPRNNEASARVTVAGERLRILLLASQPSLMARTLYKALAGDSRFRVQSIVLTLAPPSSASYTQMSGTRSDRDAHGDVSLGMLDITPYDCVVLCDPGGALVKVLPLDLLVEQVREGRKGVILALGLRANEADVVSGPLGSLLPTGDAMRVEQVSQGRLAIPGQGATHPVLGAAGTLSRIVALLPHLPVPGVIYRVTSLRAGAVELVMLNEMPLITFQRVGNGSVLTFFSSELWVWAVNGLREDLYREGRAFLEGLVAASVRYMAQDYLGLEEGKPQLVVQTDADRYGLGEDVNVEVRAVGYPESQRPEASEMRLVVEGPDGRQETLGLAAREPGRLSVSFRPALRGKYALRAVVERSGEAPVQGNAFVTVAPLAAERNAAGRRDDLLRGLAQATGGTFGTAEQVEQVLAAITPTQRRIAVVRPHPLFSVPLVLVLTLAVICGEWCLRRRFDVA